MYIGLYETLNKALSCLVLSYNNPTPLEFNQATPNAYQMIALCLCNNMTLSLTEAPLKKYYLGQRGQQPVPTGRTVAPLVQIFWNLH